ncbi:DedA family protein [Acidobacteria bacterium AB60]|nr:DedA family protein [Acidobacteria bacterium AB60]
MALPGDCGVAACVQVKVITALLQASSDPAQGKHAGAFHWLLHLGAPGVFGVALVDATIIPLAIPGSTDLLLLWFIAHGANPFLYVACGVAGSLVGGYTTWRLGKKGGEAAIDRYVPQRLQKRVQGWSQKHSILAVMLPAVLPPPIPLWPFLLAAGALGATWRRFLLAFGAGRAIRYALVGWLAVRYGRHMVHLWAKVLNRWSAPILWTFVILTVAGLVYSIWKTKRANRRSRRGTSFQPSHGD